MSTCKSSQLFRKLCVEFHSSIDTIEKQIKDRKEDETRSSQSSSEKRIYLVKNTTRKSDWLITRSAKSEYKLKLRHSKGKHIHKKNSNILTTSALLVLPQ